MPRKKSEPKKGLIIAGCTAMAFLVVAGIVYMKTIGVDAEKPVQSEGKVKIPGKPGQVIDFSKLDKKSELDLMMQSRKEEYGLNDSVDMIVKSDESIKVGGNTVSMEEILDKVRLKKGDLIEKDLEWGKKSENRTADGREGFGIYVVQPGDNIWNIHFRLLKEFFNKRGVDLPPRSDELEKNGRSSGVGRILKFSENMVYIFNLESRNLDTNIHLIHPLSKVIVYRMDEVFALLEQIDLRKVRTIRFDGETLWIPAES